ncbi:MAG: SDR family oxidoreductase, partial [Cellulophaga sp.]|nr:SDR family oxidoreductase [Cellulophaga sp.]
MNSDASKEIGERTNEKISQEEIEKCISTLEKLVGASHIVLELPEEKRVSLLKAAGRLSRPDRDAFKQSKKDAEKIAKRKMIERDKHARKETGIRSAREAVVFKAPILLEAPKLKSLEEQELESPRNCYVCKTVYTKLHHFYDTMCQDCGDFNYAKRFQTADLDGQVAIVTGSRLKIGYHITLILLRSGATVVATTRFPVDAALRFSQEDDFSKWGHRLKIHGLDLRHIPSVEIFCNFIEQQYSRLDILINNAAQTVRRPAGFYQHLMKNEDMLVADMPKAAQQVLADHLYCLNELNTLGKNTSSQQNNTLAINWHAPEPG